MAAIQDLVREYRGVVERECEGVIRKASLREAILRVMDETGQHRYATAYGTVIRTTRVHLTPRRESVLGLLKAEDLFPFTRFWPRQVQQVLVPKYGRDPLLSLFDTRSSPLLLVKTPDGQEIGGSRF